MDMLHGERRYYSKHPILRALIYEYSCKTTNVFSGCPMACADKCSLKLTTRLINNLHVLYEIYSVFDILVKKHGEIDSKLLKYALYGGSK